MFGRAIRLPFRLLGIPLDLDWTFLVILPLMAWMIAIRIGYFAEAFGLTPADTLTTGATPAILGTLAAIGLFVSVVVHELGHALVAQAFGVRVRSITLWFLGGVAQFEEMPRQRGAEALVAVVGPIVSVLVGIVCWIAAWTLTQASLAAKFVFVYLAVMNFTLAVFNLVPALPLDGGRVLRSLLTLWLGQLRGTRVAGVVSRGLAILMGLLGLLSGNWILVAIAFFVYLAVSAETQSVEVESLLRGVGVWQLMNRDIHTASPEMTVADLSQLMLAERHMAYPVVDADGKPVGMVSVLEMHGQPPDTPVARIMRPEVLMTPVNAPATEALRLMTQNDFGRVVVVEDTGRIAGLITKHDLMRYLQVRSIQRELATDRGPVPRAG